MSSVIGLSGFELRVAARGGASGMILIVFIPAHDASSARERGRRTGATEYLRTPFDGQPLIGAIEPALGRR